MNLKSEEWKVVRCYQGSLPGGGAGAKGSWNNCIQTPLLCVIVPTWDSLFPPSPSPPPPPLSPPSQPYHNTIRNLIALALVKVEGIFSDDKSDFD